MALGAIIWLSAGLLGQYSDTYGVSQPDIVYELPFYGALILGAGATWALIKKWKGL
jgi:hypothetical protein